MILAPYSPSEIDQVVRDIVHPHMRVSVDLDTEPTTVTRPRRAIYRVLIEDAGTWTRAGIVMRADDLPPSLPLLRERLIDEIGKGCRHCLNDEHLLALARRDALHDALRNR